MEVTVFFFFFQAEDGIRDLYVTGVQTCALPISRETTASQTVTKQEQFILKRLEKKRKLFGFLRKHRHEMREPARDARRPCGSRTAPTRASRAEGPHLVPLPIHPSALTVRMDHSRRGETMFA